nr:hypothetical protein [Tanacetum cinerariifolium]
LELRLKEQAERTQGPDRSVVIREPDSGRIQPLPDVQGKGKEKVVDEQAAHDLITTSKNPHLIRGMPTENIDNEIEYNNIVSKINIGDQDEGQARLDLGDHDEGHAGPNLSVLDEGQAGSNHGDATESQPQSSHVVHAGPNLQHIDLEATNTSTQ